MCYGTWTQRLGPGSTMASPGVIFEGFMGVFADH